MKAHLDYLSSKGNRVLEREKRVYIWKRRSEEIVRESKNPAEEEFGRHLRKKWGKT